MAVDVNYWWVISVTAASVVFIIWQIKRSYKNNIAFVKAIIKSKLKTEKYDEEEAKKIKPQS